jgi:hypothetical protein
MSLESWLLVGLIILVLFIGVGVFFLIVLTCVQGIEVVAFRKDYARTVRLLNRKFTRASLVAENINRRVSLGDDLAVIAEAGELILFLLKEDAEVDDGAFEPDADAKPDLVRISQRCELHGLTSTLLLRCAQTASDDEHNFYEALFELGQGIWRYMEGLPCTESWRKALNLLAKIDPDINKPPQPRPAPAELKT